ncbi:MAG TPA: arylsulfotransferase family protein [Streptosporangiaceae bacterium]|nr:arylsulfotransferase family protein [Streptosporangiaceae bacterium]
MSQDWSRRQLLKNAGTTALGLAGLGAIGTGVCGCGARASARAIRETTVSKSVRTFISRPDLSPPMIDIKSKSMPADPGYIMLATVASGPGEGGTMIMRTNGELVWFAPDVDSSKMDFNCQTYHGKKVLTWWEGKITGAGYGLGVGKIADESYQNIHTVRAGNGLQVDLHEFNLTPQGTALVTAYRPSRADLTPVGGPAQGWLVSGVAQEIDIATGKVLFEWDSLDHVPMEDTYQPFVYGKFEFGTVKHPFDYFHINSISPTSDGNFLISSRNCWTIFKVSKKTGEIMWRLGGNKSDFTLDKGAVFHWQHHVRSHGADDSTLTVFDNGASPVKAKESRALVLDLDEAKKRVTLRHQYIHPGKVLLSDAMGSAQLLPDGRMFVGWGTSPYFSAFSADGEVLLDAAMTKGDPSYRAFISDWTGNPADQPSVAARPRSGGATIYVSWNGATSVHSWTVFAGKSPNALTRAGTVRKSDFETAIEIGSSGPYFSVQANDPAGRAVGKSNVVAMGRAPTTKQKNYGGCGYSNCGY